MNFVKQHWFGFLVTLVLLLAALLFIIVLFSPRQDNQKRGFIPCTETMAAELYDCNGRSFCMLRAVLNNSLCDAEVVLMGLGDWVKDRQPTPWSNYFFTPDLASDEDVAPEVAEFYQDNPNLRQEMHQLEALHEQLLKNQEADELIPPQLPEMPLLETNKKDGNENVSEK